MEWLLSRKANTSTRFGQFQNEKMLGKDLRWRGNQKKRLMISATVSTASSGSSLLKGPK